MTVMPESACAVDGGADANLETDRKVGQKPRFPTFSLGLDAGALLAE